MYFYRTSYLVDTISLLPFTHAKYSPCISTCFFHSPFLLFKKVKQNLGVFQRLKALKMLRVTKDNVRCENKTSPTIILLLSSPTCICTNTTADDKIPRRIWTEYFYQFKEWFQKQRRAKLLSHSVLPFCSQSFPHNYLMATKRQADFGYNKVKSSSLKLWSTEKSKSFNTVVFRFVLWSGSIKLSEWSLLTCKESK